jgi:hypothetical protein
MENLKYFTYEETLNNSESKTKVFAQIAELDDNAPFKNCVIINDGNTTIKVYVNQGKHFIPVPAGTIKTIEGERLESLRFDNKSTTAQGSFTYMLDNKFTEKELLKKIAGVE